MAPGGYASLSKVLLSNWAGIGCAQAGVVELIEATLDRGRQVVPLRFTYKQRRFRATNDD